MNICKICNIEKPLSEFTLIKRQFYPNGKIHLNYRLSCKSCCNKLDYQRRKNKPEYKKSIKESLIRYKKTEKYKIVQDRYRNKPERKIIETLRSRFKTSLLAQGESKRSSIFKLLGCTKEYFKKYFESIFIENMSWNNFGKWQIDHILPCSAFDLKNSEEQEICFHYTNLRPLWKQENLKKNNKIL